MAGSSLVLGPTCVITTVGTNAPREVGPDCAECYPDYSSTTLTSMNADGGERDLATLARLPSPLAELRDERLEPYGVQLLLKRDDLIHPEMPGNKWRKLRYNLTAAREQGFTRLLTFGGAFSNHIRATAAAGHYLGFETVGVIRGEGHQPLNDPLAYATSRGMVLTYLDRATYRRKTQADVLATLKEQFGPCYL